jgi:hypothetical protein
METRFCPPNLLLVPPVEHPLLDLLAADQSSLAQHAEVLASGWIAYGELVSDVAAANAIPDRLAVFPGREMTHRIFEPFENQHRFWFASAPTTST